MGSGALLYEAVLHRTNDPHWPSRLRRHWPLLAILMVYLVAGGAYATTAPLLDVSDEVRHYAMVEQLAQGNGLPVQDVALNKDMARRELQAQIPLTYYAQEGSQPPLYYALMAVVAQAFDRSDWPQRVLPNPHALLGRADATSNWNQLIHTPDEFAPLHNTALAVLVMRFIGVLLGAVVVACAYALAWELSVLSEASRKENDLQFSIFNSQFLPVLAAALVAFNPMFVHIMASVNNDTLAAALSSLALLLGARMIRQGARVRSALALGIVLGGAALSKASGVALAIAVPVFVLVAGILKTHEGEDTVDREDREDKADKADKAKSSASPLSSSSPYSHTSSPRRLLISTLVTLLPVVLIAGWWYVRNGLLYGDPTGTTMMATIAGARDRVPGLLDLAGEWQGFFKAYWGLFGAVNIPMHEPIYVALQVMLVLAGFGLLIVVADSIVEMKDWRLETKDSDDPSPIARLQSLPALSQTLIALMLFVAFAIAFVALVRWTSITLASQGRLLFPVIAPISIFTAIGLLRLTAFGVSFVRPVTQRLLRTSVAAVTGLVALPLAVLTLAAPFVYIKSAYARPALLTSDTSAAIPNLQPTELYFEDKIRWIGYTVNTPLQRIQPGDTLDVTLYWQGRKPLDANYSAFIRLYARDDAQVTLLDTYPGGGMWQTTLWQPGDVVADRYRLRVADTVTNTRLMPTALWLDVGFWDFKSKRFLQTLDASGNPTGRQRYPSASLNVPLPQALNLPGADIGREYFEKAKVRNVGVTQTGRDLTLHVDWLVTGDVAGDYTTFVQLFDYTGKKMDPQADGQALAGNFAAKWWRAGDVVAGDSYTITLPDGFAPGQYTLKFGLYNKDGTRMPAFNVEGRPIDDAALSVPVDVKTQ